MQCCKTSCTLLLPVLMNLYHSAHPQCPANAFTLSKSRTRCQSIKVEQKLSLEKNTTVMLESGHSDLKFDLLFITSRHNNRLPSFTVVFKTVKTEVTLFFIYQVLKFQSMEYFTQLPAKETDSNLRLSNLSSITSINKFLCP